MRRSLLVLAGLTLLLPFAAAQKKALELDDIFVEGGATGRTPQEGKWSPDGKLYTYILRSSDGAEGNLWALDPETGQARILIDNAGLSRLNPSIDRTISDERERERLMRYSVAGYFWSPDSSAILFSSAGRLYLYDLKAGKAISFLPDLEGLTDPGFSPNGKWISFLKDHDIWIAPVDGGKARRLTQGGSGNLLNGELDWVYPEELDVRTGYYWSPDSHAIAFLQLDQTEVGETPIVDYVPQPHATVKMQKYPKAGEKNPKARVGLVTLTGESLWLDASGEYIPRIQWADAKTVAVQLLNRRQDELDLLLWNTEDKSTRYVLKEREKEWVNVHNDLRFLPDDELLWSSEQDGFRHLYVYDRDGRFRRRLTRGNWEVTSVYAVDTTKGWVYFAATERNPIERHAYRVRLDGTGMQRLTQKEGTHSISMDPGASYYVDVVSSFLEPPEYSLVRVSDLSSRRFFKSISLERFDLVAPVTTELKSSDGAPIRVMLLEPPGQDSTKKHPVLVYVYGGPHAPVINNAFGGERFLWHQWMARQGYVVAYIDDRTSAISGHKFETALYGQFGSTALADHRVAVQYLKSLPFVDAQQIGIWGWSGGGYTTCFDMFNAPDLFRVGVAVAPLTDFRDYDTLWSERYMGLPANNSDAYRQSSATTHAAGLAGRLLLIHGTSDDNVHLQNTLQMAEQLIEAGKMFDLFLYPRKTHSIAGTATRRHLYQKIAEYFDRYLK